VEYIAGYSWTVHDCAVCGCRFTIHDDRVYELLHQSGAISYYSDYREFARQSQELFRKADREALRRFLAATSKYRFVIERVDREPAGARILEVGCSRGYLTACFILAGRNILGADVSSEAVKEARAAFGNHFVVAGDPAITAGGPYDLIYHVGMIGCVADPVGLTRQLLSLLRPGGALLFNAPNRAALHLRHQLWLDSAPPPDVVTLFPRGFWIRQFSEAAKVTEEVELLPRDQALRIGLRRLFRRTWRKPTAKPLERCGERGHTWSQEAGGGWRLFERMAGKIGRASGLAALAPGRPADFGLFVAMVRK
jgi:SAM-dependent methyltransferase